MAQYTGYITPSYWTPSFPQKYHLIAGSKVRYVHFLTVMCIGGLQLRKFGVHGVIHREMRSISTGQQQRLLSNVDVLLQALYRVGYEYDPPSSVHDWISCHGSWRRSNFRSV